MRKTKQKQTCCKWCHEELEVKIWRLLAKCKGVNLSIQIWSDWPRMGQICDFLRSCSVHFGSASQNVLKLILKSQRLVQFGANLTRSISQIWQPLLMQNRRNPLQLRTLSLPGVRFGPILGQIGPKSDKSGTFSDFCAKIIWIWSEKSPDLSHLGPI